jgi:hypothetical protein
MSKVLVLYLFHIYNERVEHFFKHALFNHPSTDFVVIANDLNVTFSVPDYVKVVKRPNIGYDFGGWSDALLQENLYRKYDKFIFVNSSVVGPHLRLGYQGLWTDLYLNELNGDVKLFGSTINTCKDAKKAHVQSYAFAMDRETLEYLIQCEIFSTKDYAKTFNDAIWQKEVLMSRKIIENGWNIGSFLRHYRGVDFRRIPLSVRPLSDIINEKQKGKLWTNEDLVFVKGNRGF